MSVIGNVPIETARPSGTLGLTDDPRDEQSLE